MWEMVLVWVDGFSSEDGRLIRVKPIWVRFSEGNGAVESIRARESRFKLGFLGPET